MSKDNGLVRYLINAKGPKDYTKEEGKQKLERIKDVLKNHTEIKVLQEFPHLYTLYALSTKEDFEKVFSLKLNYEVTDPLRKISNWKMQGVDHKFRVPSDKIPKDLEELAVVEIEFKEYIGPR